MEESIVNAKKRTPPPSAPTRIVIVDDHALVRHGLKEMINNEPNLEVCGEAADSPSAVGLITRIKPEIAIIDLTLMEGSGLDLIKQLKISCPSVRVIVLSMHDEKLYAERALNAGAMGYVNKKEPAGTIIEAINRLLKNKVYLSDEMSDRLLRRLMRGNKPIDQPGVESLSDREMEVLDLIGKGLTTRDIADKLLVSVKTIDTYRQRIKQKLNLESGNELVHYAMQWVINGN